MLSTDRHTDRQTGIRSALLGVNNDILRVRGQKNHSRTIKKRIIADSVLEDMRKNRNWSWFRELQFRNSNKLNTIALFYRGNEISYGEMINKMINYGRSLKMLGIKKGDEIPISVSNIPEFVYLFGAISMIGAKANIFSDDFEKDYIEEIINSCNSSVIFIEDNKYKRLKEVIENTSITRIILMSLQDSLPKEGNPFFDLDKQHEELFKNKVDSIKRTNPMVIGVDEFESIGSEYSGEVEDKSVTLEDEFTITYSSGTTSNRPKGIVHAVRSYNIVSRFHDSEINHTPSMDMFNMQATLPTYSSTDLISGISDALTQGCRLALEPIYDKDFVVNSLLINTPSYLDLTKSFWLQFAKDILYNPQYSGVKIPSLTICFSVGEETVLNEEKLINAALKKVSAGRDLIKVPLSIVRLSVAGGDCEHGGIFYRLFRDYQNINPIHLFKKEPAGMVTFDMVDVAVLDKNGDFCMPYEIGRLVATSELDMVGYKNDPSATKNTIIYNSKGKKYVDCFVLAFADWEGMIHIIGREDAHLMEKYQISLLLKSMKEILSCEVIECDNHFVAHIEFQREKQDVKHNLIKVIRRCKKKLPEDTIGRLLFRVHSTEESFKLTHSGKRDLLVLKKEGVSRRCIKLKNNGIK